MKSDKNNVPQSGFTQRATIDCERDEIYVLSVSSKRIGNWYLNYYFFENETGLISMREKNLFCAEFEQREGAARDESQFILDVLV